MSQGVNIALRRNPFAFGHVDRVVPSGITVEAMLSELGLAPFIAVGGGVIVYIGDELIQRERWCTVVLADGVIVAVGITPTGNGGGGKDPTRTVAMLAVMALSIAAVVAAPYAAPFLGVTTPAGIGALGAFAGAAVSIAGSMLVNALVPLPSPSTKDTSAVRYLSGISNVMDPYGPVPRILGRRRVYPRKAGQYTELIGVDQQYLRALFCVGKGKYLLSEMKIGDTDLDEFDGVETEIFYSGDSWSSRIYPGDVDETALAIELEPSSAQTRTTGEGIDGIHVEITFPEGLYRISSGGDRRAASVEIRCEYSPTGEDTWVEATALNRLTLAAAGLPSTSIAAGQTITGPSGSGTVRAAGQSSIASDTGSVDMFGNHIYAYVYYTSWVDVEVSSGSFAATNAVTIGGSYAATVESVTALTDTITDEIGQPFKKSFEWHVPRGQYDVRVTRLTADEDNEFRSAYWTTLRTITYEPPWNLDGCTMIAMRIKATGQLSGQLDQFSLLAESLLEGYDSVLEEWVLIPTRSPAWAFVEVLCGSSNGRPVEKTRLDLTSIQTWYNSCVTAGFSFDDIIDSRTTVWELLRRICAVGRASPALTDNKYGVIEDKTQTTPVQHFSPRNSWNFSGSRLFPDVPHCLKCKFVDESNDYASDERLVYDDGYTSANATRFESIDLPGVANADHAWKLGRYHLACLRLRPETYVFDCDMEHLVATRGDLVRITHDVLMVGLGQARVKTISTTHITLDDIFPQSDGTSYGIQFRRSNGTWTTATLTTSPGTNPPDTALAFTPAMSAGDLPAVGDLCFFGEAGNESINVLISRIEPGPDLSARVTCIPYNASILTADSGTIPAWDPQITTPPAFKRKPPTPTIIGASSRYKRNYTLSDGAYGIRIRVGFALQATGFTSDGAVLDPYIHALETPAWFGPWYREDDGPWIPLGRIDGERRHFALDAKNNVTYDFRIRSVSAAGMMSAWAYLHDVAIAYTSVPPDVTGLQAIGGGAEWNKRGLNVEWDEVTADDGEAEVTNYQVQVYTSDGNTLIRTERAMENKFTYSYSKNLDDGGPRAAVQIRVKARNQIKTLSATAASQVFTNPAPAAPANLTAELVVNGTQFNWDDNAEKDFAHFSYRIKVGDQAWNEWRNTPDSSKLKVLTPEKSAEYQSDVPIYFEVKAVDIYDQESATETIDLVPDWDHYSNSPSVSGFGDYSADGYGADTLMLSGETQSYVGQHGANAQVADRLYTPSGVQVIRFDYYHAADQWYDDDFTDGMTFVTLLSSGYTLNTAQWGYNLPVADDWISLYMRKLTTARVNVATSVDGSIVDEALSGLDSGVYDFNAYRIQIDWDNLVVTVWVNGDLIADQVAFSASIKTGLAAGYRVLFHTHSYTGSAGTGKRYFRNIMVYGTTVLPSPSISPSASRSPSMSASRSASASVSPSASLSPSISASRSASASVSPSASLSPSLSASASPSASVSPSASLSPSLSESSSPSASVSPSSSASPST